MTCKKLLECWNRIFALKQEFGNCPEWPTIQTSVAKPDTDHISIRPYPQAALIIPLHRLIEGFLLSCKVENKSPATGLNRRGVS